MYGRTYITLDRVRKIELFFLLVFLVVRTMFVDIIDKKNTIGMCTKNIYVAVGSSPAVLLLNN